MMVPLVSQSKKILFATDLSANSFYAFTYAIDLAKLCNSKLVVVHVLEPLPSAGSYSSIPEANENQRLSLRDAAAQEIKVYLGALCPELLSSVHLPIGHPVKEILRIAEEEDCGLTIVGLYKRSSLQLESVRSVLRGVIEGGLTPVLVVPLIGEVAD